MFGFSREDKKNYEEKYLNKTVRINYMDGEPQYTGRTGVVRSVDDAGQLHGTWGGLAVDPKVDSISLVNN